MIKLVTKRGLIKDAVQQWLSAYPPKLTDDAKTVSIRQSLLALDLSKCSIADVAKATTRSWDPNMQCDECQNDVDLLVEFGIHPDGCGDATAVLCLACIAQGAKLAVEAIDGGGL